MVLKLCGQAKQRGGEENDGVQEEMNFSGGRVCIPLWMSWSSMFSYAFPAPFDKVTLSRYPPPFSKSLFAVMLNQSVSRIFKSRRGRGNGPPGTDLPRRRKSRSLLHDVPRSVWLGLFILIQIQRASRDMLSS